MIGIDHLLVSGSSLVFDDFGEIISILKEIPGKSILIGPSAQIIPKLAFKYGFSVVCSSKIINTQKTMKVIREGGGYRFFRAFVEKHAFINDELRHR